MRGFTLSFLLLLVVVISGCAADSDVKIRGEWELGGSTQHSR